DGPAVNGTYPLGYFREDYEYVSSTSSDYLDVHNGRFCVTPEYPAGTYAYFCTVDEDWNSYYPYVVGPTFYGNKVAQKVTSITETVTTYTPTAVNGVSLAEMKVNIFPNPASDIIAVQLPNVRQENFDVRLYDINGRLVQKSMVLQGSTIAYLDVRTEYNGEYTVVISNGVETISKKVLIMKD
ncbi:MAG TPA: T9SS type A sorting domain-containing protein, partial [Flavipsychrobacter sp.]|nr:T9SS type A sorting domain-containing protein [Flavipsychrobacter sp.]